MSFIVIKNSSNGDLATVDNKGRLHTTADTQSALNAAIIDGRYFGVNTDFITLTSPNQSALLYIRNDSETNFFLKTFRLATGKATGGTGVVKLFLQVNPTTGTLITDAVVAGVLNLDLSSQKTFVGEAFKGGEGKTATDALGGNNFIIPTDEFVYDHDIEAVIPKGFAAAFHVTPPAGNSSFEVQILVTGYYIDTKALNVEKS